MICRAMYTYPLLYNIRGYVWALPISFKITCIVNLEVIITRSDDYNSIIFSSSESFNDFVDAILSFFEHFLYTFEARPNTPLEASPQTTEKCQDSQVFSLGLQEYIFHKTAGNNSEGNS